jgi:hypothetical protein
MDASFITVNHAAAERVSDVGLRVALAPVHNVTDHVRGKRLHVQYVGAVTEQWVRAFAGNVVEPRHRRRSVADPP